MIARLVVPAVLAIGCSSPAPPVLRSAPASDDPHQLLVEAVAAKGGDRLTALKGLKWVSTGTITTRDSGRVEAIANTRVLIRPDKMRSQTTLQDGLVVTNSMDGEVAWVRKQDPARDSVIDMRGADLAREKLDLWRDPDLIILRAAEPGVRLRRGPDETINHTPCEVVTFAGPDGTDITLYLARQTKLLVRIAELASGVPETIDLSDYRAIGGVQMAHHRTVSDAEEIIDVGYQAIELDPPFVGGDFARPPG